MGSHGLFSAISANAIVSAVPRCCAMYLPSAVTGAGADLCGLLDRYMPTGFTTLGPGGGDGVGALGGAGDIDN